MLLPSSLTKQILAITKATDIQSVELIQPLWNNYGSLCRILLKDSPNGQSVILKHIQIPETNEHPRGFSTEISRLRKIHSYQVETTWYRQYNPALQNKQPATPNCLGTWSSGTTLCILLEDVDTRGFDRRLRSVSWSEIVLVIEWLAHFHAYFLQHSCDGLWECGSYWHLNTRPDELENIRGTLLHRCAHLIDAALRSAHYQTIIHGDAKLANFCFSTDLSGVCAVDFQYIGRGCGMKDLAYFISSCLSEEESAEKEAEILDAYFAHLGQALRDRDLDIKAIETEWRSLYPVAIADFQRFILGWSPHHTKNNSYTQQQTEAAISAIIDRLVDAASVAAQKAGSYIRSRWGTEYSIESKGFGSSAVDIVTEVDQIAQDIIIEELLPLSREYDLGLLAEEGLQDDSRHRKHAFWTIDPMDGTLFFAEGRAGFAVSIALVDQSGAPLLGVVYDPVQQTLIQSAVGRDLLMNGTPLAPKIQDNAAPIRLILDRGFVDHPWYETLKQRFEIHFIGGAVMNAIELLQYPRSFYMKPPKKRLGGCAIWDLAAITLICRSAGGSAQFFDGSPLHLNRRERLYFNDVGFIITGANLTHREVRDQLRSAGLYDTV